MLRNHHKHSKWFPNNIIITYPHTYMYWTINKRSANTFSHQRQPQPLEKK